MSGDDDAAANFVAITGTDLATAANWLEVGGGDLETAVALFMEGGGGGGGGGGAASSSSAAAASGSPSSPYPTRHGGFSPGQQQEEDEDGVRRPDSTKRQRLIEQPSSVADGGPRSLNPFRDFGAESRGAFGRGGSPWDAPDAGIGALFAPPLQLLFKGSFVEARAEAKARRRWLLVNVQSDAIFASHLLNRDVFKDELVASLVADAFLFWQREHTVPEARSFLDRYRPELPAEPLPLLAVVDPRTQRLLWHHAGLIDKDEFAAKLTELCTLHSFDDTATSLPPPQLAPQPVPAYDKSEDEQLALAMAASMREEEERLRRKDKGKGKGEVVNVDGSDEDSDEDEDEDSEVEVVGERSPSKQPPQGLGKGQGKRLPDTSIYSVDDDEGDEGQGHGKDATAATATATATAAGSSSSPVAGASGSTGSNGSTGHASASYLSAPLEPEAAPGTPGHTRVQFRLPDGKRLQRSFPLAAPVAALYRFAHEAYASKPEQQQAAAAAAAEAGAGAGAGLDGGGDGALVFDLTTVFPAASLRGAMARGDTLAGARLATAAIAFIWGSSSS